MKNDWENKTFERELWHLQGCTLLNQNSLHRKRRRNANAAFAQGKCDPAVLTTSNERKATNEARKGKRWKVMKLPVRGSHLTPSSPTSSWEQDTSELLVSGVC